MKGLIARAKTVVKLTDNVGSIFDITIPKGEDIISGINWGLPLIGENEKLHLGTPQSEWVDCTERLPVIDDNRWRTAKPLPVMTKSVGLTYAYACVTSTLHRYWQESSTMGNAESEECETYDGYVRGEMVGVVSWMDIKEPLS